MTRYTTRRAFLGAGATATALATVPAAATASEPGGWTTAETPTSNALYDVTYAADGAYAVGGGGYLLERTGSDWETVTQEGPGGNGNDLYGIDATDDGRRLWFVGDSGAIGEYDVEDGTIDDHSSPDDVTDQLNDVAATGEFCAKVYAATDSGAILYSVEDGNDGTWETVTPGSGAAIPAIDFHADREGHAVDDDQSVFQTTDGESWTTIGIDSADGSFFGVDGEATDDVTVSASDGTLHAWNGSEWSDEQVHTVDLRDVAVDGESGLTVGGSGTVLRRSGGGWSQEPTDTGENLEGVSQVGRSPEIAVGAGGTVLEH